MDNLHRILNITNDNYLNILVYDRKCFKIIFPNSLDEDYEKAQFAVDYPYEAIVYAEEKLSTKVNGCRFVVIDDNYIKWCENKNINLSSDSINEYLNMMSDNTAEKLWIKKEKHYDLVLYSIPIIVKYYYEDTSYSRYYKLPDKALKEAKIFLSEMLELNPNDLYIYQDALTKDDAIVNIDNIENHFRQCINGDSSPLTLVKSIFNGYTEDCFTIKYILGGIKIDRTYKMNIEEAYADSKFKIDKLFVNDEMITFSELLTDDNPNYIIYPAFDRIITTKEIASSEELLKKFLPQLILNE